MIAAKLCTSQLPAPSGAAASMARAQSAACRACRACRQVSWNFYDFPRGNHGEMDGKWMENAWASSPWPSVPVCWEFSFWPLPSDSHRSRLVQGGPQLSQGLLPGHLVKWGLQLVLFDLLQQLCIQCSLIPMSTPRPWTPYLG